MNIWTRTALGVFALVATTVTGCATAPPDQAAGRGTAYRGEVWTWDEREQTVTLRQGTETFRVRITPDQFKRLQLHETATVYGERLGPADIPVTMIPTPPMTIVPRGAIDQSEITGTVTGVDPNGVVTVDSARGTLRVWTATPGEARFASGAPVRVRISVQPVDMVPRGRVLANAPEPAPSEPAASVPSEAGDYATLTGRLVAVDRTGALTVESPRGPVTVWVPDVSRYESGRTVQVRTSIHPAQ